MSSTIHTQVTRCAQGRPMPFQPGHTAPNPTAVDTFTPNRAQGIAGPTPAPGHQPQAPELAGLPKDALEQVLKSLPAHGLQNARLACKSLAEAGRTPALLGWAEGLQEAVGRASTAERVVQLVGQAAHSAVLSHVTQLDLSFKVLRSVHIQQICKIFARCPPHKLRDLRVNGNELEDAGAQAVAGCEALKSLQHLDLSSNRLGAASAQALAASERLEAL